tara:strand:+ start:44192 stop:46102 length:1911 start_codon:yes stop_codon:yes gene_type:complete
MDSVLVIGFGYNQWNTKVRELFDVSTQVHVIDFEQPVKQQQIAHITSQVDQIIVFICSPENYIASALPKQHGDLLDNLESLSGSWNQQGQQLLQLTLQHRQKTVVISEELVCGFSAEQFSNLNITSSPSSVDPAVLFSRHVLATHTLIASAYLGEDHVNLCDYEELLALSHLKSNTESYRNRLLGVLTDVFVRKTDLLSQLTSLKAENNHNANELNSILQKVELLQQELECTQDENERLTAELVEKTQQFNASESKVSELCSENELALLQVQQLQEELEQTHLNSKSLSEDKLQKIAQLESVCSERSSENELTLLHIQQLQEELKQAHLSSKSLSEDKLKKIAQLENVCSELNSENGLALLQIRQLQEELEQTHINVKSLSEEKLQKIAQLESSYSDLDSENELVLLQVHQLKEELEQTQQHAKSLSEQKTLQIAQLERDRKDLNNERELTNFQIEQLQKELKLERLNLQDVSANKVALQEFTKLQSQFDSQLEELNTQKKRVVQLGTEKDELSSEHELALLQIHQLQDELEQTHLMSTNKVSLEEYSNLKAQCDSQQAELESEQQKVTVLEVAQNELSGENELALLQIHQLQEELEHYYIKSVEAQLDNKQLQVLHYDVPQTTLSLLNMLDRPIA